jgi:hypothetical protein
MVLVVGRLNIHFPLRCELLFRLVPRLVSFSGEKAHVASRSWETTPPWLG